MQNLIAEAKARKLLVIADAKRSDIGSTMEAYAGAWLGSDSPYNADAVTTTPWFGMGALSPLIKRAEACNCGVFIVVRSSNPEAKELHSAKIKDAYMVDKLAHEIEICNKSIMDNNRAGEVASKPKHSSGLGSVCAVIGATLGDSMARTAALMPSALILAPGIGAQGASIKDLQTSLPNDILHRLMPTSARQILSYGRDAAKIRSALLRHRDETLMLSQGIWAIPAPPPVDTGGEGSSVKPLVSDTPHHRLPAELAS